MCPSSAIDGVAVDVGPGLFTGLRVGLATARAIATARNIPTAGVTSLEALAHPHRRRAGLVAAVVDARRGEVYSAVYAGWPSPRGAAPRPYLQPRRTWPPSWRP